MAIIFLLPWLEEPENFDSCTEKCCPPIMRGSVLDKVHAFLHVAVHASDHKRAGQNRRNYQRK